MSQPETRIVRVRDFRMSYADWGDNGPPLLILHGDMRTGRSWDAVSRSLCSRFHLICPDARGHGDSEWTPTGYRFNDRVEDLAAFSELMGLKNAVGVGHSSGAVVLALYAQRCPGTFNRLVLLEPMVNVDESFQRRVSSRGARPKRKWARRQDLYDYLKQHPEAGRWRDDVLRDVVDHEARELPDGSIDMKWTSAILDWDQHCDDFLDLMPVFRDLKLPILFLASGERRHTMDGLWPAFGTIPDFQAATVLRAGHNMYMERPDAISWAVETFLAGQALPADI